MKGVTIMKYNYYESMKNDILEYLEDNYINIENMTEDDWTTLEDDLFIEDSVTGNVCGSYTLSRQQAKEYVLDNMDLLRQAYDEFDYNDKLGEHFINEDWETMDVIIRCNLLSQILWGIKEGATAAH